MSARARRLLLAALLAICVGAAVADTFDRWDAGGNDVEGAIVVLALSVGIAFLARATIAGCAELSGRLQRADPPPSASQRDRVTVRVASLVRASSPPATPLRV